MRRKRAPGLIFDLPEGEAVIPVLVSSKLRIVFEWRDLGWSSALPATNEASAEELTAMLPVGVALDRIVFKEFIELRNTLMKLTKAVEKQYR